MPCHVFEAVGSQSQYAHNHASVVGTVPRISTDRSPTNAATCLAIGTTAAEIGATLRSCTLGPGRRIRLQHSIPYCVRVPEACLDLCEIRNRQSHHLSSSPPFARLGRAVLCTKLHGSCKSPTRRGRCLGRAALPGKTSWTDGCFSPTKFCVVLLQDQSFLDVPAL